MSKPVVIGITGGSGSGKSSVAQAVFKQFPGHSLLMLEQDSYYKDQSELTFEERLKTNYDHPLAFDSELLIEQLTDLVQHRAVERPIYDYTTYTRTKKTATEEPKEVIVLEGILILEDTRLRDLMDIKIFVDTDDDIRIIRRIKRDMQERGRTLDSVIEQYLTVVKPMYHQFIEPTKRYADLVIPEGGQNEVAIDLLTTKIRSILKK